MIDVLIEHFDVSLDNVPESMKQWKKEVASDANPLAEFLSERLTFTRVKTDWITVNKDIMPLFEQLPNHLKTSIPMKEFKKLSQEYLRLTAMSFKAMDHVYIEGKRVGKKEGGVAKGVLAKRFLVTR